MPQTLCRLGILFLGRSQFIQLSTECQANTICSQASQVECLSFECIPDRLSIRRISALADLHPTALHRAPRLLAMPRELVPALRLRSCPFAREGQRPSGDRNAGFCLVRGWALYSSGGYGPQNIVVGRPCLHVRVHVNGGVDRRRVYRRPAFPPEAVPR